MVLPSAAQCELALHVHGMEWNHLHGNSRALRLTAGGTMIARHRKVGLAGEPFAHGSSVRRRFALAGERM